MAHDHFDAVLERDVGVQSLAYLANIIWQILLDVLEHRNDLLAHADDLKLLATVLMVIILLFVFELKCATADQGIDTLG